jgi:enamine deaminase RidA (YjgF/YER057c/UK114 family)
VAYGNLIFIAGVGYHQEGDIKVHTEHVPDSIKRQLESVGSSMEKVLKCNVYLNDLKDYDGMNKVFQGKFGDEPPVRTTIAAAGGIPGNSLVEIDVIALPVSVPGQGTRSAIGTAPSGIPSLTVTPSSTRKLSGTGVADCGHCNWARKRSWMEPSAAA